MLVPWRNPWFKQSSWQDWAYCDWGDSFGICPVHLLAFLDLRCLRKDITILASLGSNYIPYAIWSARNYMDEGMAHAGIGKVIAQRGIDEGRAKEIQRLFDKRYPLVLDYFGSEKPSNEFIDLGIKVRSNKELRRRWMLDQIRDCKELGVHMPEDPFQGLRQHY